jgi:hypothetical protein
MWFTDKGTNAIGLVGTGTSSVGGEKGENGEKGETGSSGAEGKQGSPGEKGGTGAAGAQGEKGAAGANGAAGAQGEKGAAGAAGAQGPAGAAGAQGPAGPAGKVQLVTCKKVGKKQKCTTKLVSGTAKFTATGSVARASLSRAGVVYATGSARRVHGRMRLVLRSSGYLAAGHYNLTLVSGHGRTAHVVNEVFTIR